MKMKEMMIKKHFMTNLNHSLIQSAVKQLKEAKGNNNIYSFKTSKIIILYYCNFVDIHKELIGVQNVN